jgi:hypothetical protein
MFMTYLHAYDESGGTYAGERSTVRLVRSTDEGASFGLVAEWVLATKAPTLETDATGDLHVISQDWDTGDAIYNRFEAGKNYADPSNARIYGGGAGKYAAYLDPTRSQIHYLTWSTFFSLDTNGDTLYSQGFFQAGPHAGPQYPHLSMTPDGILFAAWTTSATSDDHYYDIHFLASWDGGQSWGRPEPGQMVTLPVVCDDTGPAVPIVPPEEISATSERWNWLGNLFYKDWKLHFIYSGMQAGEWRTHYVRYNWDWNDPHVDLRVSPAIQGDSIVLSGLDGFFAADEVVGSPLYLCARTTTGQIGVLVSEDNGETWHDLALSDYVVPPDRSIYAVGGSRRLTSDGWLIGSFTEQNLTGTPHRVYFLRVKVR